MEQGNINHFRDKKLRTSLEVILGKREHKPIFKRYIRALLGGPHS